MAYCHLLSTIRNGPFFAETRQLDLEETFIDNNLVTFLIVTAGALLGGILGILLIWKQQVFPNPIQMKKMGTLIIICSSIGFIFALILFWTKAWA
jgi:ABC-type methionine transport system permease subunit